MSVQHFTSNISHIWHYLCLTAGMIPSMNRAPFFTALLDNFHLVGPEDMDKIADVGGTGHLSLVPVLMVFFNLFSHKQII